MLEKIAKILSEISKTLGEIRDINRERLKLEKEVERENKKGMKQALKITDIIIKKAEKIQKDVLETLGIPEKIELDEDINLGDDLNK